MSLHLEHGFEGERLRVTLKVLSQLAQEVQTALLRVLVLVDISWTSLVLHACGASLALLCVGSMDVAASSAYQRSFACSTSIYGSLGTILMHMCVNGHSRLWVDLHVTPSVEKISVQL